MEIKQGSFIQQTQYFIPVEIDLSVVPARLGISDFFTGIGQKLGLLYIINNALNETEDAQLRNGLLLIPYLINIFFMFYYDKQ